MDSRDTAEVSDPKFDVSRDFTQGAMVVTNNPLDLAISGPGFFQLRNGSELLYSRQGQFRLNADGTVVTPQGYALQQAGGGDLVLDSASATIAQDGTVTEDGRPVARIALYAPSDPSVFSPVGESHFAASEAQMAESPASLVRQGSVENSNVSSGTEMVTMMMALRQAESGARLVQVYDDLLGRAITSFGSGGR